MNTLTDGDVQRIAAAVRDSMRRAPDDDDTGERMREFSRSELVEHHRFVAELIAEKQAKHQLWLDMRKHVMSWGAVGVITALGVMAWHYAKDVIIHLTASGA